jgi:hypothetical protein
MSEGDSKRHLSYPTVPLSTLPGNDLFEAAVSAVALDESTVRWMLTSVLRTIGATPENLTPEELGNTLPEVDRRLRQLVQPEQADKAMARLYSALMGWSGSAPGE